MTDEEILVVVQGHIDGEVIQSKWDGREWQTANVPVWNFNLYDYRIKPKPLELWALMYDTPGTLVSAYTTKDAATYHSMSAAKIVHMRGVDDEIKEES